MSRFSRLLAAPAGQGPGAPIESRGAATPAPTLARSLGLGRRDLMRER